jgi:hypothetical protein
MGMCGNNIQRVQIMTYSKTVHEASEFKYLTQTTERVMEIKLQTYNKIKGIINRKSRERILKHPKKSVKYGSEASAFKEMGGS